MDRIVTFDGELDRAEAGQSVTLTLADEVDVSRGDVLAAATEPAPVADQFEADMVWMSEQEMLPGRQLPDQASAPSWCRAASASRSTG